MNLNETGELLARIQVHDNRSIGAVTIEEWHHDLRGVNYADALAAVRHHRRTSATYLTAQAVLAGVTRIRATRLEGFDATAHLIAEQFPDTPQGNRQAQQALLAERHRVAGGGQPQPMPELVARDMRALTAAVGSTFRRVPRGE